MFLTTQLHFHKTCPPPSQGCVRLGDFCFPRVVPPRLGVKMDSLEHMLTDPLELGPCGDGDGDGHGGRIMEDCMLGSARVSLPEDLLEDVSSAKTLYVFRSLMNSVLNSFCGAFRAN